VISVAVKRLSVLFHPPLRSMVVAGSILVTDLVAQEESNNVEAVMAVKSKTVRFIVFF
jgi:hypothetical protein